MIFMKSSQIFSDRRKISQNDLAFLEKIGFSFQFAGNFVIFYL